MPRYGIDHTPGMRYLTGRPMKEISFQLRDGWLNAAVGPENGPTFVLLHGVQRQWRDFAGVLPQLCKRFHVIAIDHRGHGGSHRTSGDYEVRHYASDVIEFMTRHLQSPAAVWGHSLGAMVAGVVAGELPGAVSALILEDPPGSALGAEIRSSRYFLQFHGTRELLRLHSSAHKLAPELANLPVHHPADGRVVPLRELRDENALRFAADCLESMDPRVLDSLVEGKWMNQLDWFGKLNSIACPSLLLRGNPALGGMLEESEAVRMANAIRELHRVDLPETGHSIHYSQPQATVELIFKFLDRYASGLGTRVSL